MTKESVIEVLKTVIDPEVGVDIVRMGMVKNVEISDGEIKCEIALTTPACPLATEIKENVKKTLEENFGKENKINIVLVSDVRKSKETTIGIQRIVNLDTIKNVKNIIGVYSCKGGVGKSTLSVNLALALAKAGAKVGLLDLDLHGPNIPLMLGIVGTPKIRDSKIQPVEVMGMKVLSIGLLIDNSSPVVWRGPIQTTAVKQLFEDVNWGDLDYLILDLPPGSGDIQLTLAQNIPISGIVTISTPQLVAVVDTIKGINLFEKVGIPNLGIVINMAYYVCSHCGEKNYIFPKADIDLYLKDKNIPILGEIPIDPLIAQGSDQGKPIVYEYPEYEISKIYREIASKVASSLSVRTVKRELNIK
jgi:ATP-binding protein involved in chromosome partitioning